MKILLISIFVSLAASSIGSNKVVYPIFNVSNEIKEIGKNIKRDNFNDPCLDAALEALDYAYADEQSGWSLCASIHTTGQGYYDCAHFATMVRQFQVEFIYANLTSCPSGSGFGWANNKKTLIGENEDLMAYR